MLRKNFLLKKRMKGQLIWELLLPLIIVAYMKLVLNNPCNSKNSTCSPEEKQSRN